MTIVRWLIPLVLFHAACPERTHAKTIEQRLAWSALPPDLAGKKVKVETAAGRGQAGTVVQVTADGLTLSGKRGSARTVARGDIQSIEWRTRKKAKWSIAGAAIGAAPGVFTTWFAVVMKRNEGGIYSDRNIGIAAGILGAGAALGALAGHAADADRHVIRITGP